MSDILLDYQYARTYENFAHIVDNLTWYEKWRLGDKFNYWKISAIYSFTMSGRPDINPSKIISQYLEAHTAVLNDSNKKYLMPYMYAATGYPELSEKNIELSTV
jgi:hypothetical protein